MSTTYTHDEKLPPLPVPDLISTASKYLKSLQPILTEEEYKESLKAVSDFIAPGGVGEDLQKRLLSHSKEQNKMGKSWLEDWWLEFGYLRGRYPLPINLSCHLLVDDLITEPASYSQTMQAARFTHGLAQWKELLEQEKVPPELAKGKPLDMNQYRVLFTSERQPRLEMDALVNSKATDKVVVLSHNQFYVVDLKHQGKWLTVAELELQMTRIKEDAVKNLPSHGVGEFTTLPRDDWAKIREELSQDSTNKQNLDEIEKCVFVITLDRNHPKDYEKMCFLTAAGISDRWYDKIVNFIFYQNSKFSVLLEHTPCDAPIIGNWVDQVNLKLNKDKQTINLIRPVTTNAIPIPKKMKWNLTNNHLNQLKEAHDAHTEIANTKDYKIVNFLDFGTDVIKSYGVSPDSFMQLSLQLTFYKIHKYIPATYETGHTRFFKHGRTETCRPQSNELVQWIKAMEDNNVSPSTKFLLLKLAESYHLNYMADAVRGYGCDRHLLGLRLINQLQLGGKNTPSIFADKGYSKSSTFILSTSNVPSLTFCGGFGNAVDDGYGCCYQIKPKQLDMSISTTKNNPTNGQLFKETIIQSFRDIRNLLDQFSKQKL